MLKVRGPEDPVKESHDQGTEMESIDSSSHPSSSSSSSSSSSQSTEIETQNSIEITVEDDLSSSHPSKPQPDHQEEQTETKEHEEHENHAHIVIPSEDSNAQTKLMAYFLMFVLSVHSFIAGLALGVQDTSTGTIAIFIAIISHKWVEAIALGSSLLRSSSNVMRLCVLSVIYTSITPIGIIIGFLSQEILKGFASNLFNAIITGISAGTFIYVATVDILTEEFRNGRDRFLKFSACVFGFSLTAFVVIAFDTDG